MFDDLQELLGIKLTERQQVALKELARRKNDTLQVFNPLPEDYYVEWGLYDPIEPGGLFLIPSATHDIGFGPGKTNVLRFVATKFFKESANLILQSRQRVAINAENDRRVKGGFKKLSRTVDNDEELQFLAEEGLMINHDKYLELLPKIILGIVHEWGLDTKPIKRFQRTLTLDELQQITDREIGTEVKPELVGVTKIQEQIVSAPLPQAQPQPTVQTNQPDDPLQGVAA